MKKQDFDLQKFATRFSQLLEDSNENTYTLGEKLGLSPASISRYTHGIMAPKLPTLYALADIFEVNPVWLLGFEAPKYVENNKTTKKFPSPSTTEDFVTFPVYGDIAAGYDSVGIEDWSGDVIDIPTSYLKGRSMDDFIVLRVKGNSMFPTYQDGDKVLVLKQPTLNYSGQVGAILYDGEYATLKKVEYTDGEDWMRLVPINPNVESELIEGERLTRCRIIGIPKLLIRDITH